MIKYMTYPNYAYYIRYTHNDNDYTIYAAGSDRAREWCEAQLAASADNPQETWERITKSEAEARCLHLFGIGHGLDPLAEMCVRLFGPEEQLWRSASRLDYALERDEQAALDKAKYLALRAAATEKMLREAEGLVEAHNTLDDAE